VRPWSIRYWDGRATGVTGGVWRCGIGHVWGPTTEAASVRAIHRALALGVNFFDVAPSYGHGKAERFWAAPCTVARIRRSCHEGAAGSGEMHDVTARSARRWRRASGGCDGRRSTCCMCTIGFTPRRGDLPHSLSADDVLGPVLEAYQQMQHAGKTRFIGVSAWNLMSHPAAYHGKRALRYRPGV